MTSHQHWNPPETPVPVGTKAAPPAQSCGAEAQDSSQLSASPKKPPSHVSLAEQHNSVTSAQPVYNALKNR